MTFRATKTKLRREHDQAVRAELRRRRATVQQRIKDARKSGRLTLAKVREQCRRSFKRLRDRAAQIRATHRELARQEIEPLRQAAQSACSGARSKARRRTARELEQLQREERSAKGDEFRERSTQGLLRKRDRKRSKPVERHEESDSEVASNLEPELRPVWEAMKTAFRKPVERKTRTEQFLEWVHDNPGDAMALQSELQESAVDDEIARHEAELRAIQEDLDRREFEHADLERLGLQDPERCSVVDTTIDGPMPEQVQCTKREGHRGKHVDHYGFAIGGTRKKAPKKKTSKALNSPQAAPVQDGMDHLGIAKETYKEARARILQDAETHPAWKKNTGLKVPWFEDDERRIYLKPQAAYYTRAGMPFSSARSLGDFRRRAPRKLLELAGELLGSSGSAKSRSADSPSKSDVDLLRDAVRRFGDLHVPEAAAHLQWDETRTWKAASAGLRSGALEQSGANGALVVPEPGTKKERLLRAFDALNEKHGGRYYVALKDVRAALPFAREDFDRVLNELRADWVLTLSPAEGRHEHVPRDVLDAGISENGRNLVYVSRREP